MWCGGLSVPWELVHAVFHPSITNQVGPALNSQSLCSQYLALLKPPTKQSNWLSCCPSGTGVNLVRRLNVYEVSCSYSREWADQSRQDSWHGWGLTTPAGTADPGGTCLSGTLCTARAPPFSRNAWQSYWGKSKLDLPGQ